MGVRCELALHIVPALEEQTIQRNRANFDLAVIGGGIVGLWATRFAIHRGLSVALIEKNQIGGGASGGILGALMPHQPRPWNAKKQSQFEALVEMEQLCAALESETGLSTGYRRAGRLMPIASEKLLERQESWADGAREHWRSRTVEDERQYSWTVSSSADPFGLLAEFATTFGHAFDDFSAVVTPRKLVAALKAAVETSATIYEQSQPLSWDEASCCLEIEGESLAVRNLLVTAGADSTAILNDLGIDEKAASPITGIKGQGALLRPKMSTRDDIPMIYGDGIYLIPHEDGTVGVGSTTEKEWSNAHATDEKLDGLLRKATALCPWLDDYSVIERWAQLRPKGPTANPVVEQIDDRAVLASGGYKTGLAFAPTMARLAIDLLS